MRLLVYFYRYLTRFEDSREVVGAFNVDPLYLKHQHQDSAPDLRVIDLLYYIELQLC